MIAETGIFFVSSMSRRPFLRVWMRGSVLPAELAPVAPALEAVAAEGDVVGRAIRSESVLRPADGTGAEHLGSHARPEEIRARHDTQEQPSREDGKAPHGLRAHEFGRGGGRRG